MSTANKPRHQLVDVKLTEISLVDRPANQGSEVVLFKRDSEDNDMPTDKEQLDALTAAVNKAEEALGELTKANDELVTKNEELTGKIDELTGEIAKRDQQIEQIKKAQGDDGDEITKALKDAPEPVAKAMQALTERLALAETLIAKSAEEKDTLVFVVKAKAFDKLPTTAEKLGPVLMRVAKGATTKDDATEIERLLKAANEAIGAGAGDGTEEIGKRGGGGSSAMQKIEAKADEIRKADTSLTKEMAISKALESDPALYEQYLTEARKGA